MLRNLAELDAGARLLITSRDQAEAAMAIYAAAQGERYAEALRDWGLRQTPPGIRRLMVFRHGMLEVAEDREVRIEIITRIQPCKYSNPTRAISLN